MNHFNSYARYAVARIVLAMSGGVDSSVAAALLRQAGHDVIGVFMRHGQPPTADCATSNTNHQSPVTSHSASLPIVAGRTDHKQGCCTAADAADARRVADLLGIPFYALDLSDDFARIMDYFVDEYTAARTPNPCVVCNNWLKFGKLFEYADSVGAEFVATGHYARVEKAEGSRQKAEEGPAETALLRGLDPAKDQSYVLFGVERRYLTRMMLPVGEYRKPRIRELARSLGLQVADKRDSQEICFVSSGDHADFVRRRRASGATGSASAVVRSSGATGSASVLTDDTSGDIVTADGTVVGRHQGIESFTIGQRKGLRVALGSPYYVTHIEPDTCRVVIGPHEQLARRRLTFDRANWLVDRPSQPLNCQVQIRYNSRAVAARVEPLDAGRYQVDFDEPQYGVAPGQAAVCYEGQRVLGGGWIE